MKSIKRRRRVRLVPLWHKALSQRKLEAIVNGDGFNDVLDDLVAFTGLTLAQVMERVKRTPLNHYQSEFRWHSPRDFRELSWYYRVTYGYLFGNAAHPYWSKLDFLDPSVGPVLDYGGGVGNNVITLAERGFDVHYTEISLIQESFLRFRAARRGLDIEIIEPYADGAFDPVGCIDDPFGAIILQDVLEHVPDYQILLGHLIAQVKPGGYIIENSPFNELAPNIDIHLSATVPLESAMRDMTPVADGIWQRIE